MDSDPRFVYRPMLDLIGRAEGTDPVPGNPSNARGYNETLDYGRYTGGPVSLVAMTLDEVENLQSRMLPNVHNSTAVGRYQIVRKTLRGIRNALRLSGKALYDAAMQDRLACFLLGRRGIDEWLAGELSQSDLIDNLAKEWASLPTTRGTGHYSGQRSRVTVANVKQALAMVRQRHNEKQQSPVPVPEVPPANNVSALRDELAAMFPGLTRADIDRALLNHVLACWTGMKDITPTRKVPAMNDPSRIDYAPLDAPPKSQWKSRGAIGGIVASLSGIIGLFLGINSADINEVYQHVAAIVAAVSGIIAWYGRVRAKSRIAL